MSKGSSNPPSFLSFVKKASSVKDESSDDDRAVLLPSNGSSFNLMDDSAVLNAKALRRAHKKGKKSKRTQHQKQLSDPMHSRHVSTSTIGSGTSRSSDQAPTPSSVDGADDYFNGYGSEECSPKVGGEISLQLVPSKESVHSNRSNRSNRSNTNTNRSINTIHSGRSYRGQNSSFDESGCASKNPSHKSERSSKRQLKLRKLEKRREWMKRHRRRHVLGVITLVIVYSLLFFYTIIITIGPLALDYWVDPMDWCPYYEDLVDASERAFFADHKNFIGDETVKKWNIDILQRTSNDIHQHDKQQQSDGERKKYDNPDYNDSPCHITRIPSLFYLTLEECDLSRRMAASIVFGGLIGSERRAQDKPAGIRTMALVALGSW